MTNSYYKISLDIHNHGSYISLKAKKGATDRILHITLTDGGKPYAISSDSYAVFTAKKADGNILYNECSIIGNTIAYAFTPQTTSAVGQADCEIRLYGSDSKLLVSARFALIVEDTVYSDSELESKTEVTALTALIARAVALLAGASGEAGAITDEQIAALTGEKGDDGKSAYEFAKDGGYTGTEEEFSAKLAGEYAPAYTYGTEDLVAGETELETGKLHFVYE